MMESVKCFPEGIAKGGAFINRQDERSLLKKRIISVQHTVLMAPRRYGKTSLVVKVAEEMKIPSCAIDLLAAYNSDYVRNQIIGKVGKLVFDLMPKREKAKEKVISIFRKMNPEITLGAFGQKLSFALSVDPLQDITEVLLRLDKTATYFNKRAVIFIDEFQQISQLKDYHAIEASIRHAVERSENIAYVFSGSNRRLLKQMFGDSGRPLYRLCQLINIERIHKKDYEKNLQLLAQKKWGKKLSPATMNEIFELTELHPYYMNVLCQTLWKNTSLITVKVVHAVWHEYVKTQRQLIRHDIIELSANQRKLITALAAEPHKELQSSEFTVKLKISASSSQQSAEVLLKKDLIWIGDDMYYKVLDPAVKYYLSEIINYR